MAAQSNGITVVAVNDEAKTIRLFVGSVDLRLQLNVRTGRFEDRGRWWIDGRRSAGRPRLTPALWHQAMRQAHGIRTTHCW